MCASMNECMYECVQMCACMCECVGACMRMHLYIIIQILKKSEYTFALTLVFLLV